MGSLDSDDENNFKKGIENLKRDPHTAKHVVTLLDRNGDSVDLERFLFEELLGKKQRKCKRLKETVIQLSEEKEKLTDHVKTIEEKRDMLFMENLKMENAKNNLLFELGRSKRKCQELEVAVTQLKLEKIETDKTAELYKSKLENSSTRIERMKENFAKMSTMMVGDVATLINDMDELGTHEMQWHLDSQGLRGRNENSLGNANVDVMSPSNGIKNNGLSTKGKKILKVKDKLLEQKSQPSDVELSNAICEILKVVDLNKVTFTDIMKQLAEKFKSDLTQRKKVIKLLIQDELTKLAEEEAALLQRREKL